MDFRIYLKDKHKEKVKKNSFILENTNEKNIDNLKFEIDHFFDNYRFNNIGKETLKDLVYLYHNLYNLMEHLENDKQKEKNIINKLYKLKKIIENNKQYDFFNSFYHPIMYRKNEKYISSNNNKYYLYNVYYINCDLKEKLLGELKIISINNKNLSNVLKKNEYKYLDDDYISVGYYDFYENLMELNDDEKNYILSYIKDCVFNDKIYKEFEKNDIVNKYLFNDIIYENIFKEYNDLKNNICKNTEHSLNIKIDESTNQEINIKVVPNSLPPTNINAIIGRNASGKTQLLIAILEEYIKYINEKNSNFKLQITNSVKNELYKNINLKNIDFYKLIYISI